MRVPGARRLRFREGWSAGRERIQSLKPGRAVRQPAHPALKHSAPRSAIRPSPLSATGATRRIRRLPDIPSVESGTLTRSGEDNRSARFRTRQPGFCDFRGGRAVEGACLEIKCTVTPYRGFDRFAGSESGRPKAARRARTRKVRGTNLPGADLNDGPKGYRPRRGEGQDVRSNPALTRSGKGSRSARFRMRQLGFCDGEVAERSKALAWKASVR